jgi:hypothetical protein
MNASLLDSMLGRWICIGAEVVLAAIILGLGTRTALLRDSDPSQPDFRLRTYSLAKSQLAFWTAIILGSFIYLYFRTCQCGGVLNNTALILLGISSATSAASAVAGAPPAPPGALPGSTPPAPPTQPHRTYLDDILSDAQGMNLHRVQMALWTVVFGGIFLHQVAATGNFPTFGDQAYLLMGLSSATYVWFKRTET